MNRRTFLTAAEAAIVGVPLLTKTALAQAQNLTVTLTYTDDKLVVNPKVLKANIGDTVTFKLMNQGAMILTWITASKSTDVNQRCGQSLTITLGRYGYFQYGCSAMIKGEMEGWLDGDPNAGGEIEVPPPGACA
jgi:plastocyanin